MAKLDDPSIPRTSGATRVGGRRLSRRLRKALYHPWLFQAAIVALLVGLAAWEIDLREVVDAFSRARYEFVAAALVLYVAARWLHAVEWKLTLTKVGHAPTMGLLGVLLVGTLVNMVVPASAGDVAKIQIAANRYGLSRTGLVATRGAEAVVNALIMVGFIGFAFAAPGAAFGSRAVLVALAAAAVTLFVFAVLTARLLPEEFPAWPVFRPLPQRVREWGHYHWPRFHAGFEVIRRWRLLSVVVVLNLLGWGEDIVIVWLFGEAFHLSVPFSAYVSVTVAVAIVTTFPITVGNIGTYELLVTSVVTLYGASPADALAFSIGMHLITTAFNIGLGLVAIWVMRLSARDVFELGSRTNTAAPPPPIPDG